MQIFRSDLYSIFLELSLGDNKVSLYPGVLGFCSTNCDHAMAVVACCCAHPSFKIYVFRSNYKQRSHLLLACLLDFTKSSTNVVIIGLCQKNTGGIFRKWNAEEQLSLTLAKKLFKPMSIKDLDKLDRRLLIWLMSILVNDRPTWKMLLTLKVVKSDTKIIIFVLFQGSVLVPDTLCTECVTNLDLRIEVIIFRSLLTTYEATVLFEAVGTASKNWP